MIGARITRSANDNHNKYECCLAGDFPFNYRSITSRFGNEMCDMIAYIIRMPADQHTLWEEGYQTWVRRQPFPLATLLPVAIDEDMSDDESFNQAETQDVDPLDEIVRLQIEIQELRVRVDNVPAAVNEEEGEDEADVNEEEGEDEADVSGESNNLLSNSTDDDIEAKSEEEEEESSEDEDDEDLFALRPRKGHHGDLNAPQRKGVVRRDVQSEGYK